MNTIKTILSRFKSWATWVSVAGAVWLLLSSFGITEKIGITSETWNTALNALGALLTAFGIVNNPTDKEHF